MKRMKSFILSAGLLSMIVLTATGCGSNETAPTKEETAKTPPTTAVTTKYVGDDACKSCHDQATTAFHGTKHSAAALKPLTEFQLTSELPKTVALFDGADPENKKPTQFDLSTAKLYGVMVNDYVLAEVPGFKNKLYRVAKLVKNGDKYDIKAAKSVDVDKDGTEDWQAADAVACAKCHAPGYLVSSPNTGISCESCHGPGGDHIAAAPDKKKGSFKAPASNAMPNTETCLVCHKSDPDKDEKGNLVANNHYGARNWFATKHAQSAQLNGCMACHEPHKANASGHLIRKDNAADVCASCHKGAKLDLTKLMWKNPTDERNHFTADHSFGNIKYEDMGDDPATKATEITNPAYVDLVKKALPELNK